MGAKSTSTSTQYIVHRHHAAGYVQCRTQGGKIEVSGWQLIAAQPSGWCRWWHCPGAARYWVGIPTGERERTRCHKGQDMRYTRNRAGSSGAEHPRCTHWRCAGWVMGIPGRLTPPPPQSLCGARAGADFWFIWEFLDKTNQKSVAANQ
jgi:hypothetical protein